MIVVWRITTRCNLACPFCAYDRRLAIPRATADPASIRELLPVLADYQHATGRAVLVSWLGGEPLLWSELPALTTRATSLGLRVSATTNGTALASVEMRRHVLDHYSELTVSLDALGSAHDTLRSAAGLFESLRATISALSSARLREDRPLKIRINTVLFRETIDHFSSLAREIASWGVDELTFNTLGGRDRPEYFAAHRPLSSQLARLSTELSSLRAELAPSGLKIAGGPAYLKRLETAALGKNHAVADCAPGERFLFVDEQGLVSPCSFTTTDLGVPMIELKTADDLIALPARFTLRRSTRRPLVCDNCPSTQVFEKFAPATA